MCNHPLCEEPPPDVKPKFPLPQLNPVPAGPVTGVNGEKVSCLSTPPYEEVVDCDEVSPQPPLLQARILAEVSKL